MMIFDSGLLFWATLYIGYRPILQGQDFRSLSFIWHDFRAVVRGAVYGFNLPPPKLWK